MGVEQEIRGNSLPLPPNSAENSKRFVALREGKDLAEETLGEISVALNALGYKDPLGPQLIRSYNIAVIATTSNPEQWKDILEETFNPLSPKEVVCDDDINELAVNHKRHMVLIQLGFIARQDSSSSKLKVPWQKVFDKKGKFFYFSAKTSNDKVFLALTPGAFDKEKGEFLFSESLVVAPNEETFQNFWLGVINGVPNEAEFAKLALSQRVAA